MQRDQSDQELNFKKRARRRLVGAIALVFLMVILLPMVLKDRAAGTPQEKITISLPNEASTTVMPNPAPTPSEFDSNIVPSDATPSEPEKPAEPAAEPAAPEVADTPTGAEVSAKPEAQTKPATQAKPETTKPQANKPEAAKKFYVQIGVFSDPANVKQLQSKLGDLGYKSQTEKIKTDKGEKIRLKTQVFADRNEAAIALTNIKDAGLTGMVVSQ